MKYKARQFLRSSYNKYDEYGKTQIIKHLIQKGHSIIKEKEDFKHDLITTRNGLKYFFEVEVKINYPFTCAKDFQFKTVSFLGRKKRLHKINPFWYIILCYETGCFLYCHSSKIFIIEFEETLILKDKNRKGLDKMYRVPINKCYFFEHNF